MAGDLNIRAEIEYVLKDQGITAAVKKIDDLEKQLKKATAETKKTTEASNAFGRSLQSLKAYAASFLAAGTIINFLKSSQREFIEAEKSAFRLQMSLRLLGNEYASSYKDVSEYADELERLTGVDADLIRSAQSVLVTIGRLSGDTLKRATRAALDLSAALGTDLNGAAMILAKAGVGAEGALAKMGIRIDDNVEPARRLEEILTALEARLGGVAEEMGNTIPGAAQRSATAFGNLKEAIGELFTTADGLGVWTLAWEKATAAVKALGEMSNQYSDWFVTLFGFGSGTGVPKFPGMGADTSRKGDFPAPPYEVNVSLKDADKKAEEREKKEEEARKKREEEERKLEERIAENRTFFLKQQLEKEMEERGKAIDERMDLEKVYLADLESVSQTIDDKKAVADEILQIAIDSARQELDFRKASLEEQRDFEKSVIDKTVSDHKIAAAKKAAIDAEYAQKKTLLVKYEAEMEKLATMDAVLAGMELLGQVFGEKKGFAIALALMNTHRAVTAILADETMPTVAKPAAIAAAVAMGMAQVAKIRSTNLSGGGGGGGGSYSAGKNFSRNVGSPGGGGSTGGSGSAGTQQSSSSVTYDNSGKTEVHFHAPVVGGKEGARELVRIVERAGRQDRARKLR